MRTPCLKSGLPETGRRAGLAVACSLLLAGAAACGSGGGSSVGAAAHTATTTTTPTTGQVTGAVGGGAAPTTSAAGAPGTGSPTAPAPASGPAEAQQLATVQQQLAGVPGLLDQAATANQAADPDQARAAEGG